MFANKVKQDWRDHRRLILIDCKSITYLDCVIDLFNWLLVDLVGKLQSGFEITNFGKFWKVLLR